MTAVVINGVNFRCSPRLKKEIKKSGLVKVKRPSQPFFRIQERQERMIKYLKAYSSINQRQYAALNGCSRYCATKDIKMFLEQGIITCSGSATHRIYLLKE